MLPNTSSSSDDITTRPWVREIITGSSNHTNKKMIHLFISSRKALVFFFYTVVVNVKRTRPKGKGSKQRETKEKAAVTFQSFDAGLS